MIDMTHNAEPQPQANANPLADEASAAKRSKIDLSPPATPPKRPAPEVRSCDLVNVDTHTSRANKYCNTLVLAIGCAA